MVSRHFSRAVRLVACQDCIWSDIRRHGHGRLHPRVNRDRNPRANSDSLFSVDSLGDRHGENILLDTTNGDCVHVDFNCLFGMVSAHSVWVASRLTTHHQGFTWFEIAEKVPFRLTQNVVDGFGVTGVEGVFRKCCEITMRILRENRTPLVSVLESFVHDPLVELGLSPPSTKVSLYNAQVLHIHAQCVAHRSERG